MMELGRNSAAPRLTFEAALALIEPHGWETAWVRHCLAVSRVAGRVGDLLAERVPLDREYLRVGALLHDIGRSRTHDAIGHGVEGYRILTGLGHHREAYICASHILCGLGRDEAAAHGLPHREFLPCSLEEKLVPMIDSVVELDRPTTLEKRIASIMRRYAGNVWFLERMRTAHERARTFIADLEREQGIALERIAAETLGADSVPPGSTPR